MQRTAISSSHKSKEATAPERKRNAAKAGALVVAAVFLVAVLVGAAIVYGQRRALAPASHQACVRAQASDPDALFEAFFQNPSDMNALVQIERKCTN